MTSVIAEKGTKLTEEEKKARADAKAANEAALQPYMQEAIVDVARIRGTTPEVIANLAKDIVQIRAQVKARAEHFKKIKEGPAAGQRSPRNPRKWADKLTQQFQRVFGFAKLHKVSDADIMAAIKVASENPVVPTRTKKETPK